MKTDGYINIVVWNCEEMSLCKNMGMVVYLPSPTSNNELLYSFGTGNFSETDAASLLNGTTDTCFIVLVEDLERYGNI